MLDHRCGCQGIRQNNFEPGSRLFSGFLVKLDLDLDPGVETKVNIFKFFILVFYEISLFYSCTSMKDFQDPEEAFRAHPTPKIIILYFFLTCGQLLSWIFCPN